MTDLDAIAAATASVEFTRRVHAAALLVAADIVSEDTETGDPMVLAQRIVSDPDWRIDGLVRMTAACPEVSDAVAASSPQDVDDAVIIAAVTDRFGHTAGLRAPAATRMTAAAPETPPLP